ncbi:MAG: MFS transporter [Anaerolineae bacterium]
MGSYGVGFILGLVMVFFFYEELNWTTVQFGIVVGVYGLAMVIGQAVLGQSSDRFGRKPVIILGILLTATFYAGLAIVTWFPLMMLVAMVAGLGAALTSPALSAFYLDITSAQHRSRVVGIKESAASLGGVVGPLLVVGASAVTTPQGVFVIAGVLTLFAAGLTLVALRSPRRAAEETGDVAWECSSKRAMAAQTALRGVVLRAASAREARVAA